ncbi:MAG: EAL domain-containing protein [Lachnospiraceae bacterium]
MEYQQKHKRELHKKIFSSLLGIAILQIGIVGIVFFHSGILGRLDDNSKQIVKNFVATKQNDVERQMADWENIDASVEDISSIVTTMEQEENKDITTLLQDDARREIFLQRITRIVLRNLRDTKATESFLILEGTDGTDVKEAIYLRDGNPLNNPRANRDILAEAGRSSLLMECNIALDSYWSAKITIPEKDQFYRKPLEAGEQYQNIAATNLGYWSTPLRLHENDSEIITYTIPLMNQNHQTYGVIGIGVNLAYLESKLSENQISIDPYSAYYLGVTEDGEQYRTVLTAGSYYKSKLPSDSEVTVRPSEDEDLYHLRFDGKDEKTIAGIQPLKLYNSNTPFEQEQWALAGMVRGDVLHQASQTLKAVFSVAIALSFLLGVIGAIILTGALTAPLKVLMKSLSKASVQRFQLAKTGVKEFDELAAEIERLSTSIFKAGSKVADIVEESNLSMGICDYDDMQTEETSIFCTKKFLEILELPMGNWSHNYINKKAFQRMTEKLKQKVFLESDETDVYWFVTKKGTKRWIHIKTMSNAEHSKDKSLYIVMDVTTQMEEKKKIQYERDYDVLTDLCNRRAFVHLVKNLMYGGKCYTAVLSMWDLDNLKYINDTYGHDIGDQYICLLADTFKQNMQDNMIIARMSGDEFVTFIYNEDVDTMCNKLRDIHKQFLEKQLLTSEGELIAVSVSAGMSLYRIDAEEFDELLRYADFAMYEMKKKKKGAISLFDRNHYIKDYILVQGVGEFNRIICEEAVRYVFQPIVDIKEKRIFGYEALMRPDSDMLRTPTEFIRLATAQSQLGKVEKMTWFCAISQFVRAMSEIEDKEKYLFINSIPKQSMEKKDFVTLENLYGSRLNKIVMEITETAELEAVGQACEQAKNEWCRQWDVQIALDDYGSGYSNSGILLARKFDFVKIDRNLIKDIDSITAKQEMTGSTIEFCHTNHIKVIAEGIETKAELDMVIQLGVDYVQGYYLGRPSDSIQTIVEEF